MNRRTVGFEDVDEEYIEEFIEDVDDDVDGFSHAVRLLVRDHARLVERVDDLEGDLEHAEARADDLRRQLREANRRREEMDELVTYVESERSAEQRRREAGLLTRARWWVRGMPSDDESDR